MYTNGARSLQDRFATRRLADRLADVEARSELTHDDCAFIRAAPFFFLATASRDGSPLCSYKGGLPGFVRVTGTRQLAFPSYDGNGTYRSLGNLLENPKV